MGNEIIDDELLLIKNTVESKCIEHNVIYADFTFDEYKIDRDNSGCFTRNGQWY